MFSITALITVILLRCHCRTGRHFIHHQTIHSPEDKSHPVTNSKETRLLTRSRCDRKKQMLDAARACMLLTTPLKLL
uniref:Secreted protein n=1 Tax=Anopheles funestus TaxID=62324 RepID=A0A182S2R9_ANOFN